MDQWLEWKHGSLRQGCAGIVRRRVMKNLMKDYSKHSMALVFKEVTEEREARLLVDALKVVEDQIKFTNAFLVRGTNAPTLADFAVFEEIDQLVVLPSTEGPPFGSNIGEKFPNVEIWLNKIRAQPGYAEIHKALNDAAKGLEKMRQKPKL